ncbi:MAG: DUF2508 family protein [Dehalobacterium sp.]
MIRKILSFVNFLRNYFISSIFIQKRQLNPSQEYVFLVDEARRDWRWANSLIHEAKELNLIDQAIYWQSAAERKYVHLLKQAAQEGIKADFKTVVFLALAEHNEIYWGVGPCKQKCGRSY